MTTTTTTIIGPRASEVEVQDHTVGARIEYAHCSGGYRVCLDTRQHEWPNAETVMTPVEAMRLAAILTELAADAELENVQHEYASENEER